MKIAIISDTHDNLANLKKAISWIKKEKIKVLIHCGDIFKPETIKEILNDFKGEIHLIFSNVDADFSKIPTDSFKNLPRVKTYERFGELKIDGNPVVEQAHYGARKIAFCHFPEIARDLAKTQKYDLVFYGHTHKPWEETPHQSRLRRHGTGQEIRKTRLVNSGNIAGILFKPTFAVYDTETDKLELNPV